MHLIIGVIDEIAYNTEDAKLWMDCLQTAICEYAYHPPFDAILFVKEVKMQLTLIRDRDNMYKHRYDYDRRELDKLEKYLLNHAYEYIDDANDDKKKEENENENENAIEGGTRIAYNTFKSLKNDSREFVENSADSKVTHILTYNMCSSNFCISKQWKSVIYKILHFKNFFFFNDCAKYIVTKVVLIYNYNYLFLYYIYFLLIVRSPQQAKNDRFIDEPVDADKYDKDKG